LTREIKARSAPASTLHPKACNKHAPDPKTATDVQNAPCKKSKDPHGNALLTSQAGKSRLKRTGYKYSHKAATPAAEKAPGPDAA
jgi:hypothetical protein